MVSKSQNVQAYYANLGAGGVEEVSNASSKASTTASGFKKAHRKKPADVSYNSIKNLVHQALLDQQRQDEELLRGYYQSSTGSIKSGGGQSSKKSNGGGGGSQKSRFRQSRSKSPSRRSKSPSRRRRSKSPALSRNQRYQKFTNGNDEAAKMMGGVGAADDDPAGEPENAIEMVLREPSSSSKTKKKKNRKPNASAAAPSSAEGETSKPSPPPTVPQQEQRGKTDQRERRESVDRREERDDRDRHDRREQPDQRKREETPERQQTSQTQSSGINGSILIEKSTVRALLQSLASHRRNNNVEQTKKRVGFDAATKPPAESAARTTKSAEETAAQATSSQTSVVQSTLENILRNIDMDTEKQSTIEQQQRGDSDDRNDCASVASNSSSIKSILKNANPASTPQSPRRERACETKRATSANTKANARTSTNGGIAVAPSDNDDDYGEIGGINRRTSRPPKKGLFGSFMKRKSGRMSNRISAAGTIETIVYKKNSEDGSEKPYKGTLHKCPKNPGRIVMEIQSMSNDDDDDDAHNTTSSNEGRGDIETGILRRKNYQQRNCGFPKKVPILAEGCPDAPMSPPCGSIVTEFFGGGQPGRVPRSVAAAAAADDDGDDNSLLDNFSCNPLSNREPPTSTTSTAGLDSLVPIKKVRFSFDEADEREDSGDEDSGASDRSTKRGNKNKKSRKLHLPLTTKPLSSKPRRPWPLTNASILDFDSEEDDQSAASGGNKIEGSADQTDRAKIVRVCLVGLTATFAVLIVGLLVGLTLFFVRLYQTEDGFLGGGGGRDGVMP